MRPQLGFDCRGPEQGQDCTHGVFGLLAQSALVKSAEPVNSAAVRARLRVAGRMRVGTGHPTRKVVLVVVREPRNDYQITYGDLVREDYELPGVRMISWSTDPGSTASILEAA